MFNGILTSEGGQTAVSELLLCTGSSAVLGLMIALCYMFRSKYSKSFVCTLVMLPVIVQAVIMLVNGNVGTGVAVMGAFSLVRFRSVPGTSREIGALFLAMTAGIATGMGQLVFAFAVTGFVCLIMLVLTAMKFGGSREDVSELKITVPEDMDFENAFDDILSSYTLSYRLISSKTTNMGSLYELKYEINLKEDSSVKRMIDEIRCRNGNLTVVCGQKQLSQQDQL
ncbi:MAG: DUF4956 domain-containing protein [Oscillospiraceae bacterium]|nr:DUF4956 domain-containing protein [Oscillospiraceae bacterium]